MPAASADVWRILYTVSRYLFPLLAVFLVLVILAYILSESRKQKDRTRNLPGSGSVGELIVLSGSRDLDVNTWFPVPREGVLGSVRSCDLVIPCPGIRPKHLDFSWEDGRGLLLHPRTGCEAVVNGFRITCRSNAADCPLTHGSILQVGSAVLRLHLFAALDHTALSVSSVPQETTAMPGVPVQPVPVNSFPVPPAAVQHFMQEPSAVSGPAFPSFQPAAPSPAECSAPDAFPQQNPPIPDHPADSIAPPAPPEPEHPRPEGSGRWKEDLGE